MTTEQALYDFTKKELLRRYPSGWGGVAGMRLSDGTFISSISPDFPNAGSSVCMELGAMLEAANRDLAVTHTLCLVREDEHAPIKILTPCGICQERLSLWGNAVRCGITTADPTSLHFASLQELQPHHWLQVYADESK